MNHEQWGQYQDRKLEVLLWEYPFLRDFFEALQLPVYPGILLRDLPKFISEQWCRDKGYTADSLIRAIGDLLEKEDQREVLLPERMDNRKNLLDALQFLTISEGHDKDGRMMEESIEVFRGETVCVTGTTGSGKTRLLEDIECLASGDTPSGRHILLNGEDISRTDRELLHNWMCSYLAQTMNYVLELSCRELIFLHAKCRGFSETDPIISDVLTCANQLAGEPVAPDMLITQLSGGQSRALMIADLVYISSAPVVLIDEPENAGIDKTAAIHLLRGSDKIVLISTHDPVLALSCQKRILLKNGAIVRFTSRSAEEETLLHELEAADRRMQKVRNALREDSDLTHFLAG